jgi:hypothetical protein
VVRLHDNWRGRSGPVWNDFLLGHALPIGGLFVPDAFDAIADQQLVDSSTAPLGVAWRSMRSSVTEAASKCPRRTCPAECSDGGQETGVSSDVRIQAGTGTFTVAWPDVLQTPGPIEL